MYRTSNSSASSQNAHANPRFSGLWELTCSRGGGREARGQVEVRVRAGGRRREGTAGWGSGCRGRAGGCVGCWRTRCSIPPGAGDHVGAERSGRPALAGQPGAQAGRAGLPCGAAHSACAPACGLAHPDLGAARSGRCRRSTYRCAAPPRPVRCCDPTAAAPLPRRPRYPLPPPRPERPARGGLL